MVSSTGLSGASVLADGQNEGVQSRMILVVNFFCFVVAMSDLVHNVEA